MYEYACELVRVIDGDTVVLDIDLGFRTWRRETVRLAGINAPERKGATFDAGHNSMAQLKLKLVDKSLVVQTELDRSDKYGRTLGTIFADGVNVNQRMVNEGLAVPYGRKPPA